MVVRDTMSSPFASARLPHCASTMDRVYPSGHGRYQGYQISDRAVYRRTASPCRISLSRFHDRVLIHSYPRLSPTSARSGLGRWGTRRGGSTNSTQVNRGRLRGGQSSTVESRSPSQLKRRWVWRTMPGSSKKRIPVSSRCSFLYWINPSF